MNTRRFQLFVALAIVSGLGAPASAQTVSLFQVQLRPLNLPLIGKTFLSGSDAASQTFESVKHVFLDKITSTLPEGVRFTGASLNRLDPTRLYFNFAYAPRIYFLYEGACYDNALGVTIAPASTPTSRPTAGLNYIVFPLVHSSIGPACSSGSGVRAKREPLLAGDYVQLPTVNAGQQLAFFIMSQMDAAGNPANVFYNGAANNADKFQHLIAFFPDNSQYMIIGFEDMFKGGDKDCNDLMFAVDIGANNAAALRTAAAMPR